MSTARDRLKFGEDLMQAFCAGAANVIFRHSSTGVWVREVREYASTYCTREYSREKFVDPTLVDTKAGKIKGILGTVLCIIYSYVQQHSDA